MSLLEALRQVEGPVCDSTALRSESIVQRQRLDDLVGANDEHAAMVRQLEQAYDHQVSASPLETNHPSLAESGPMNVDEIPSADELAAELEQFLRDQGPN